MSDSILRSIKNRLPMNADDNHFDPELIDAINTYLSTLQHIGVGPDCPFHIDDDIPVWDDFDSDEERQYMEKTYVYTKTKILFDPPQSSAALEALKEVTKEMEWRLNTLENKKNTVLIQNGGDC